MKESNEGCVYLKQDPATFRLFGDFVYSGTYDVGEPPKQPNYNAGEPKSTPLHDWCAEGVCRNGISLLEVVEREYFVDTCIDKSSTLWLRSIKLHQKAAANAKVECTDEEFDHTGNFLTHAKLYVFTDYHGVDTLKKLSLHKLCDLLVTFWDYHYKFIMQDFVELAVYCFANTADKKNSKDPLREVVVMFATCVFDIVWEIPEFREVVANESELSIALIEQMRDLIP